MDRKIKDLLAEIGDSLPDLIDVANGLNPVNILDNLPNVQQGLALIQKQVSEISRLVNDP